MTVDIRKHPVDFAEDGDAMLMEMGMMTVTLAVRRSLS